MTRQDDPLERGGGAPEIPRPGEREVAEVGAELIGLLLQSLGRTAEQVAESLRQNGIRGVRGAACGCPIYEWLVRALNRHARPDMQVLIDSVGYAIGFRVQRPGEDYAWGSTSASSPIRDFIVAFDKGIYPGLEVSR